MPKQFSGLIGKIRKFVYAVTNLLGVRRGLLYLLMDELEFMLFKQTEKGLLTDLGWVKSARTRRSVDFNDNPIPWLTYPAIFFLKERLHDGLTLFEYGSGSSTSFWAQRIRRVASVEHNHEWYERTRQLLENHRNVSLFECASDTDGAYCRAVAHFEEQYHMILIDGNDRVNCMKQAVAHLTPDGVIILDDSQREEYVPGTEFLISQGFKRLDFYGFAPSNFYLSCTTFFYKAENCLQL